MWSLMALAFFGAGVAKLRTSGLSWVYSGSMGAVLLQAQTPWATALAGIPLMPQLFAASALLLELSAPLALVSRWARALIIPGLFSMQLGIWYVMKVDFRPFMMCYLFWVPWGGIVERLANQLARRGRHGLLIDGSCGLCRRTAGVVRRLDVLSRVDIYDVVNEWPAIATQFPTISQDSCLHHMHLMRAGKTPVVGFDAYRALAWSLPMGWLILPLLYMPGVPQIGRQVYASVAAQRARTGCAIAMRD
jgi:predicted DCC family thiol-disulfide oxidoreductase YuxK